MSTQINTIEILLENSTDVSVPVYLDATSLRQFSIWIRQWGDLQKQLVKRFNEDGLRIIVFDAQLKNSYRRKSYNEALKGLEEVEAEIDTETWGEEDDVFAAELKLMYFHDEASLLCDLHAKFLVLARYASASYPLKIITAYPSFHRVVNVDLYMLPDSSNDTELPANLNIFADLNIHERLRQSVSLKFLQKDYVGAVNDAVQEFFAYLQSLDPSASSRDGWNLVDEVLGYKGVSYPVNNKHPEIPKIKLTPFISDTEKNDHKGYYHFVGGVYSAFRNIGAHHAPSSPERKGRFDDKRTAIKIICFISLLFEKLDQRCI